MKSLAIVLASILICLNIQAQAKFEMIPEEWDFDKEENFQQYESNILEAIDLLAKTPIAKNNLDRNRALKFINNWGIETPTLIIVPFSKISKPIFKDLKDDKKKSSYGVELFMSYYSGMLKHLILDKKSELKDVQLAGIESVLRLYKNNPDILSNSQAVAEYTQLQKSGELEDWIAKRLSKHNIKAHDCYQDVNCSKRDKYTIDNPAAHPEI